MLNIKLHKIYKLYIKLHKIKLIPHLSHQKRSIRISDLSIIQQTNDAFTQQDILFCLNQNSKLLVKRMFDLFNQRESPPTDVQARNMMYDNTCEILLPFIENIVNNNIENNN